MACRTAILISGSGTNLQAFIDQVADMARPNMKKPRASSALRFASAVSGNAIKPITVIITINRFTICLLYIVSALTIRRGTS